MLQLNKKPVLIVGGGKIAARKAPALIAAGAKLTILSPELHESLQGQNIQWIRAEYQPETLAELRPVLLFAATNQPALNQQIAEDARKLSIFANLADNAEASDFHNMAILEKVPFTVAISSGAASPALLSLLKQRLASALSDGLILFAQWLGELRVLAREEIDRQESRQALYERLIASDVLHLLETGKSEEAKSLFNSIIEEAR